MSDYFQPDFYRFNQDSLKLVNFVKRHLSRAESILDIGAGSGIIGMELARALKIPKLTLLELQEDFRPYLEQNKNLFIDVSTHCEIIITSLGEWETQQRFDLIVCNPPYYLPGRGQDSSDPRRNLCRNFKQDGWELLIKNIRQWLTPNGRALIVVKNDSALLKECERIIDKNLLEKRFHFEGELCFIEIYPRD